MPRAQAMATLVELAELAGGGTSTVPSLLPYVEAWLTDREPPAASVASIDAVVLRAMVAAVPSCATARLADRLLVASAGELFAPSLDQDGEPTDGWREEAYFGEIGFSGA